MTRHMYTTEMLASVALLELTSLDRIGKGRSSNYEMGVLVNVSLSSALCG